VAKHDPPSERALELLHYLQDQANYIRSYPATISETARLIWFFIKRSRGMRAEWPLEQLSGFPRDAPRDVDVAGVSSIRADANPALTGAVTLAAGSNVTLTEVGQTITIAASSADTLAALYKLFPGDKPPAVASAYDDEFGGSSLDPKWSWVNQGGASFAESAGNGRIVAPTGTDNWRMLVQPCPAGDFTVTFSFVSQTRLNVDVGRYGLILRASGSGKLEALMANAGSASSSQQMRYQRWNSPTSFNADVGTIFNPQGAFVRQYVRCVIAGNLITAYWSWDGWTWAQYMATSNITTFLGANRAALDQIGFGISNNSTGVDAQITAYWFRVT
jgi:hypothetical protein